MATSYKLRIKGKISGPFSHEKVLQFIQKGKVDSKCQYQENEDSEWMILAKHESFKEYFTDQESTSFINLDEIQKAKSKGKKSENISPPIEKKETIKKGDETHTKTKALETEMGFSEFKFGRGTVVDPDYSQMNKDYEKDKKNKVHSVNQTVVNKPQRIINIDKTIVVNPAPPPVEVEEVEEVEEVIVKVDTEDKTQFLNTSQMDISYLSEINESEEKIIEEKEKFKEEIQKELDVKNETIDEVEGSGKKVVKKMTPIVAFTFMVLLYFLVFDENDKKKVFIPKYVKLTKIFANEFADEARSEAIYEKALATYNLGTFAAKKKAVTLLKKSLANHTENKKSMALLILTYAEILENISNKRTAKHNFNILLRINESKILKDPTVATGAAIFYSFYGKHESAIRIIKNYLRLGKKTKKLLATYLKVLIKAEKLTEARKVFLVLESMKRKSLDVVVAMSQFYALNEDYEQREKMLKESLKKFPASVQLLLEYADTQFQLEKFKSFQVTLEKIEILEYEQSPYYYAKFLEYLGLAAAISGKNRKAIISFKESLKFFKENDVLRSRLASLEAGGSKTTENLINESKSVKLMEAAREEMKRRNWQKAFIHAIDAVDISNSYIPAKLLLAEIQTRRGYFERAITTLVELKAENPMDINTNKHLINAYINAHRYNKAQEQLTLLSREKNTVFTKTAVFSSLQGRLYHTKGNIPQAIDHLKKATLLDPLNDQDFYLLAQIFLKYRKYGRAKASLLSAIKLEPNNVDYRAIYAKILYELDSVETAIGYLKKFLEKNKDDPKLLGEIATYHYLNGDNREFNRYKKMVEKLNSKDKAFYEFLIEASKLENKPEDIIKYAKELIKVEPGDLRTRMLLGKYLFQQRRYGNAQDIFNGIKERLSSYPKVHYYLSKILIELRKYEEALKMGEQEIEKNPELTYGYFATGNALMKMQNYPLAVTQFERAISKDGTNVEALMALGEIRYGQNFLDSALQLYLRAKRHSRSNATIYKQLGYIYRRMGQSGLARENFQVYLNRSPLAQDRGKIQLLIDRLK